MEDKKNIAATKSSNKEKKGATQSASMKLPRMAKELEFHVDESCQKFKADKIALNTLKTAMREWVPVGIYFEIVDLMSALHPLLAQKVADYIADFCWGNGRTLTGINSLDLQLISIYKRIYDHAQANGYTFEPTLPF